MAHLISVNQMAIPLFVIEARHHMVGVCGLSEAFPKSLHRQKLDADVFMKW